MRRRRRSNAAGAAVSLFSFQDIMSAVMGILILVTLMMALDLTVTASQTPQQDDQLNNEAAVARAEELKRLQSEIDKLRAKYESAMRHAKRLAEIQGREVEVVVQARQALEEAYRQINQLQDRIEQAAKQLAKAEKEGSRHDMAENISRVEAEFQRLQNILDQRQRHPRLTYIAQAGPGLRPILVELTDSRIGLAGADNPDAATWLTARNRLQQFERILKSRDREKEYFVILLKPSAFGTWYESVSEMLNSAGFAMGTELVNETVIVLPNATE